MDNYLKKVIIDNLISHSGVLNVQGGPVNRAILK